MKTLTHQDYVNLGKKYRLQIVDILIAAGRGHVGAAFSVIDILTVLFESKLKFDAKNPQWPDRDRLILSKGHGCLALYPLLAENGYFAKSELNLFCKPEGILGGHPDSRKIPGVEIPTGSLGHGLSVAIGFALAARLDRRNYNVYVILGDGECNEGSIWEGALSAAKHQLSNLVVLIDYNKMQSYDLAKNVLSLEPLTDKLKAFGFATREVDMNYPERLQGLLAELPFSQNQPNAIICHTTKGKGVSFVENNPNWHHKNKLTEEEIQALRKELA